MIVVLALEVFTLFYKDTIFAVGILIATIVAFFALLAFFKMRFAIGGSFLTLVVLFETWIHLRFVTIWAPKIYFGH